MFGSTSRWLVATAAAVMAGPLAGAAASESSEGKPVAQTVDPESTPSPYFPEGVLNGDAWWYAKRLAAMNEPPLGPRGQANDSKSEVYRFLWLRSFDNPIAVRLERADGRARAFLKKFDRLSQKLVLDRTRELTDDEWGRFIRLVESSSFWELPPTGELIDLGNGVKVPADGQDGARWIMEGSKGGKYHVVDRWSPDSEAKRREPPTIKYRELCLLALRLSGLDIDQEKVY